MSKPTLSLNVNKNPAATAPAPAPAPDATASTDPAVSTDGAVASAPADTSATTAPAATDFAALLGTKQWLRVPKGRMVNLHTNEEVTERPRRLLVDQFAVSQLVAGKFLISED